MSQTHPIQNDAYMLVTTVLRERTMLFTNPAYAREAIDTLYDVQNLHPFFLHGFVIMPDHAHFLIYVPFPASISKIMNVYKGCCSMRIGAGPIWQRRFHLKIAHQPIHALSYIHDNPIKAGLVERPEEYPWSSASGRWDVLPIDAVSC